MRNSRKHLHCSCMDICLLQSLLGGAALMLPVMAATLHSSKLFMQGLLQMAHAGCTLRKKELAHGLVFWLGAGTIACWEGVKNHSRPACAMAHALCVAFPVQKGTFAMTSIYQGPRRSDLLPDTAAWACCNAAASTFRRLKKMRCSLSGRSSSDDC